MTSLEGRVALVTGASRGIGRATALELARRGAVVALNYASQSAAAEEAARLITEAGGAATIHQANISVPSDVEAMVEAVTAQHGQIDILVNNAGITRDNLTLRIDEQDWDSVLDTNLKGAFLCAKAVIKGMMRRRYGRIINMSSVVGLTGNAGQANYAASKAGLLGLTRSLAREFASRGVTVNAVAPGFIATEMTEAISDEAKSAALQSIPLGRLGTPEDVAHAVAFLASDEAAYITGQVLVVDGGMVMS